MIIKSVPEINPPSADIVCTVEEAAECAGCLGRRLASIDYELVFTRGDYIE